MQIEEINILGVNISKITKDDLVKILIEKDTSPFYIVTPNPEMVYIASIDKEFKNLLNNARYKIPDGIGIIIASKILGNPIKERISGINVFDLLNNLGKIRVFLLGSRKDVVKKAAENLKEKYRNIEAIDYHNGYFGPNDNEKIIKKISNFKPTILLVGLGCPKQEEWIYENYKKANANVTIGVGGSFDVISGLKKRAPLFICKIGLEWFYRFLQEPAKRAIRILRIPLFMIKIFIQRIKNKK